MNIKEMVEEIIDKAKNYIFSIKKVTVIVENDMGVIETFSREWNN